MENMQIVTINLAEKPPDKFLEVRISILDKLPGLLGLCAGYENGQWRSSQLAGHLMEWLPEFALNRREREGVGPSNMVALTAKAARLIYDTIDIEKRGEIGEILLHAIIRHEFGTIPAISKIYFKDSPSITVKGFDAVHIVVNSGLFELWLGESKFYSDFKAAINAIVPEIKQHIESDYLRSEFTAIFSKIDPGWKYENELKELISRNNTLDKVFRALCIPAFVTYESQTIAKFRKASPEFVDSIKNEIMEHYEHFCKKDLPQKVKIHLLVLPIENKDELINYFDEKLKACQIIAN
jgi:hypothetical protein